MLKLIFKIAAALPLPLAHGFGIALGWLAYLVSPRYRRRMKENIAASQIADSPQGFHLLLNQSITQAGKAITELPFAWFSTEPRLLAKFREIEGWDAVVAARAEGCGVLMLTPHLGCFEALGRFLSTQFPCTVMYRPPKLAWLEPILQHGRRYATTAAADLSGVRIALKALKRGDVVCVLPDQAPGAGQGVWADFFGRPAYTMTLIQKLQQKTGAAIIVMYVERLPHGQGFRPHFQRLADSLPKDETQAAGELNRAMESLIRLSPSQYLWSYNRYKAPSGAKPAPATLTETAK